MLKIGSLVFLLLISVSTHSTENRYYGEDFKNWLIEAIGERNRIDSKVKNPIMAKEEYQKRDKEIRSILSTHHAYNWSGTVTKFWTNSEGASIQIKISDGVFVETGVLGAVKRNSRAYEQLKQIVKGDKVRFSGKFRTSNGRISENKASENLLGAWFLGEKTSRFEFVFEDVSKL